MTEPTTLYHYCSTPTFHKIIEDKNIKLSSLSLSNDSMEGKLVGNVLEKLANSGLLTLHQRNSIMEVTHLLEEVFDGIGFCLSEEGDLLSQWRGYADDGKGISIGFSKAFLDELSLLKSSEEERAFKLQKVIYLPEEHIKKVTPIYSKATEIVKDKDFNLLETKTLLDMRSDEQVEIDIKTKKRKRSELVMEMFALIPILFTLKSEAFVEEREWRLLAWGAKSEGDGMSYTSKEDCIIPCQFKSLIEPKTTPINEIILGPKHLTPIEVVKGFLTSNGFNNVDVKKSKASYR